MLDRFELPLQLLSSMALNVDWNYIQALFVQGFGPQQISDKTGVKPGTIRSRAVRLNWYEPVPKRNSLSRAHYRNPWTLPTARRLRWNRSALKRAFPASLPIRSRPLNRKSP